MNLELKSEDEEEEEDDKEDAEQHSDSTPLTTICKDTKT